MYNKLIISGDMIESFKYEKLPFAVQYPNEMSRLRKNRKPTENEQRTRRRDNAVRAKVAFGRLCATNFSSTEVAVFATLTFAQEKSIGDGYSLFAIFTKRLRRYYGSHVRYIAVPEFGTKKTKRLHFHALFWGLPLEQVKRERETRDFANCWQYGFVELVVTDNDPKVGFYLAKYLSKAYQNEKLFRHKSYITSRNIKRPEVIVNFVSLYEQYIYNLESVDNRLVKSLSYETMHLGRCDYKLYNKKKI